MKQGATTRSRRAGTAKKSAKSPMRSIDGGRSLQLGPRLRLTVIVPVYNEQHLVEASLRRLLALDDPLIAELQVVVVDDCSTDGSRAILERLAAGDKRIELLRHPENRGKGAAIRTGLARADSDVTVVHDADLEYDPNDIPLLLRPFVEEGADAVFGSRYMSAPYRRALMFRHSLMNRALTTLSNLFTDLDLTDVETCYKAVRTPLLKSIPLRSRDFRIEIELPTKLAKRRARIYEVPIRYSPRSYEEGKKIGPRDGLLALSAMLHFALIDDIYQDDEYGSNILNEMGKARQFNDWLAFTVRPFVGDRVLEIGAGIGTLTNHFIPRQRYVASDVNPHYLHYLRAYALGKPYLSAAKVDVTEPADFVDLQSQFDTVIALNVLEHVTDERGAIANIRSALLPLGRLIAVVPQHPALFGTLDLALGHRKRYTKEDLRAVLTRGGFEVERIFDFNRFSVPGWWVNGKLLKRRRFSRLQIKTLDTLMPLLSRADPYLPWSGQSLVAIAHRPAGD